MQLHCTVKRAMFVFYREVYERECYSKSNISIAVILRKTIEQYKMP